MEPEQDCLLEGEALRLAQQGNAVALEVLYRLHRNRVYALCLRMVKNRVQAEDLTQETFLAVLRGIREFRGHAAFTTWLHQVTRNTVLMFLRKKQLTETSLEEITVPDGETGRPPLEIGTRDRHLEATADRMALRHAVSKLSKGFRKVLLLHDLHGYEHKEVAAILGWAPGTSKSQLHKARARVREFLKKYFCRQTDSAADQESESDNLARKSQPDIPRWCQPLDKKPSGTTK